MVMQTEKNVHLHILHLRKVSRNKFLNILKILTNDSLINNLPWIHSLMPFA